MNSTTTAPPAGTTEAASEEALFDKSRYDDPDLALPKIDGETIDKIAIDFTGRVFLDRANKQHVELMRAMHLGEDITLTVEARCSKKSNGYSTDREGELDVVVLSHGAKVHTVYMDGKAAA